MRDRILRERQVRIALCQDDAEEIGACAAKDGVGVGTFVRLLVLRHLAVLVRTGGGTSTIRTVVLEAPVKLGCHIVVLVSDDEYALIETSATASELTVSGYLGRRVIERWLKAKRAQAAKSEQSN